MVCRVICYFYPNTYIHTTHTTNTQVTMTHVVIFPTPQNNNNDNSDNITIDTENTGKHFQALKFAAETRRLPLFIFWIFMGVAVMVAGALAHHRTSWQAFWNQDAVLDRQSTVRQIPLGPFFDSFITALNRVFVRGGWIVAMLVIVAVQVFYLGLVAVRRDRVLALRFIRDFKMKTMAGIEAGVLVLGTGYFLLCTWSFVMIASKIGSCTHPDGTFTFPTPLNSCQATFKGFDISGHCFLIVHSCLFVLEYASKVVVVWRGKEERMLRGGAGDKDSDVESVISEDKSVDDNTGALISNTHFNRHRSKYHVALIILLTAILSLCLSEFLIFLQTILFYHTVLEKILGTVIGAGYWIVLYLLSRKYPHLF